MLIRALIAVLAVAALLLSPHPAHAESGIVFSYTSTTLGFSGDVTGTITDTFNIDGKTNFCADWSAAVAAGGTLGITTTFDFSNTNLPATDSGWNSKSSGDSNTYTTPFTFSDTAAIKKLAFPPAKYCRVRMQNADATHTATLKRFQINGY